jgi:hypothetical protein
VEFLQLQSHLRLQYLLFFLVSFLPQVCSTQASLLQAMEQGEAHSLNPLSLQHRDPEVGSLGPLAWL